MSYETRRRNDATVAMSRFTMKPFNTTYRCAKSLAETVNSYENPFMTLSRVVVRVYKISDAV